MNRFINYLKRLFERLFYNNEVKELTDNSEKVNDTENGNNSFIDEIKEQSFGEEQMKKEVLANKLLSNEIDSYDLSDEEANEMIEYFKEDIDKKQREIEKVKQNIIKQKRG